MSARDTEHPSIPDGDNYEDRKIKEHGKSYPFKEMIEGVLNGDTYFSSQDWVDLSETLAGFQAACEYKDKQISKLKAELASAITALDAMLAQARHDVLMKAAEEFYECPKRTRITVDYTDEEVADRLRRMAEGELKS